MHRTRIHLTRLLVQLVVQEWWAVVNWAKVSEYYEKFASKGKPVVWG